MDLPYCHNPPNARYKSKTGPRPKVARHVRTKTTTKGFPNRARRFWPYVHGCPDPGRSRGWPAPHGRGDNANTSPATRSVACCVASARSCTSAREPKC